MIIQDKDDLPPMISYAQNFEDVMLRRALADVERGFYVDIGAFDPLADSVTKWFYDCGWTGVNVEPNPQFFARLQAARVHDTNLNVAVSDRQGEVELVLLDGLSTIDPDIAEQHARDGLVVGPRLIVSTLPLSEILTRHVKDRAIDFLKIDVEGLEGAIIRSTDFSLFRPRIMVVEATVPNRAEESWQDWEEHLLKCNYLFAYFDGLNRFYVRAEDEWRMQHFSVPPNVFDRFAFPATSERVNFASGSGDGLPGVPRSGVGGLLDQRDQFAHALAEQAAELARETTRVTLSETIVRQVTGTAGAVFRGYATFVDRTTSLIAVFTKLLNASLAGAQMTSESDGGYEGQEGGRVTSAADPSTPMSQGEAATHLSSDAPGRHARARWNENTRRLIEETEGLREELHKISTTLSTDIAHYFHAIERSETRGAQQAVHIGVGQPAASEFADKTWAAEHARHSERLEATNGIISNLMITMSTAAAVVDNLLASSVTAANERHIAASAADNLKLQIEAMRNETAALDNTLQSSNVMLSAAKDKLKEMMISKDDLSRELLQLKKERVQGVMSQNEIGRELAQMKIESERIVDQLLHLLARYDSLSSNA